MKRLSIQNNIDLPVLQQAFKVLSQGGLIIFPTETVYGAGVDATNQQAVEKLLKYKSRREGKPLSIAVTDQKMADQYVELNEQALAIYEKFLPGPITVVSKNRGLVADGVASEFNTLGVRIPDHPIILKLVEMLDRPITATSANASGKKKPYSIEDILNNISDKQRSLIDLVIDAGTLPKNPPSTVIDTTLSTPVVVRLGSIKNKQLGADTQSLILHSKSEIETKHIAGRLLLQHWDQIQKNGLVIGLNGVLGVGKTIFTKGIADFLKINEVITSPTYTYIEEYSFSRHQTQGYLYHLDMWKVNSSEEFEKLEIEKLLGPKKIVVIEWFDQVKKDFEKLLFGKSKALKSVNLILILMTSSNQSGLSHRKIEIIN